MRLILIRMLAASAAVIVLLNADPSAAQAGKKKPATEQSDSDREARRLFKEGDRLYAEGDYEGAVRAFEQSFELSQRPTLKYNLANSYERLGRYEEGLRALREYEPHASAEEREVVRRRIKKLEERAEQQRQEKAAATDQAPQAAPAPAAAAAPAAEEPTKSLPVADTQSPPILGYVLLGVGAVGLGVGTYFGLQALSTRSDAEDACTEAQGIRRCPGSADDTLSTNKRNALIADVSIGVGIVAAAVGTFFVIKGGSKEVASARVQAAAGPKGGELSVVGAF